MSIKIESIKNKTGVVVTHSESADNATHATNADQATRALAVPATGIEGLTVSGDIKKTTENDTVNLSVDVPIFVGDLSTSFAEWKAAFDAGKRLEFKNIVSTDIVIPADQIPNNEEDDENFVNEEEEEPEDYTGTLTFNDIKLFYEKWEEYKEEDGPKAPVEDEPTYNESIVVTMANEYMYLAFYLDENDIWTVYLVGSIGYMFDNPNTIEICNFSDYPYYYYDVAYDEEPEIVEEDEEEPYIPYYHPGILFVGHLDNDWKKILDLFEEWWGYEYEEPHPFSYVTSEEAYMAFDGGLNFIIDGNYLLPSYLKVFYAEFNGVVTLSQPTPDTFVCYDYQNKKILYVHLSQYDDSGFLPTRKLEIEIGSSGGTDGIFIGNMDTSYQEWREAYDYSYQGKVCYLWLNYNENGDSPCLLPMTWKQLSFTYGDGPTFTTPDDSFAYYKVYIEVDSDSRYNCGVFQTYNGEIVFEYDENPDLLNPIVYPFFTYYGWDYYNERNCETNSTEILQDFEEKFKPKLLVEDTTKYPYEYKLYDYVSDKWSDYDEEHDCPVCKGTGQIEGQTCEFCGGTGKVNWEYYTRKFTFQRITDKIEKYEVIEEYPPYKPIYDEETETWDWDYEDYYEINYEINKLPDEGFGTSNVFIGGLDTTFQEWYQAITSGKLVKFNTVEFILNMVSEQMPNLDPDDYWQQNPDSISSELINSTKIEFRQHENILDESSEPCVCIKFTMGSETPSMAADTKGIFEFHLNLNNEVKLWAAGMTIRDKLMFTPEQFVDNDVFKLFYIVDVNNYFRNDMAALLRAMMRKPDNMTWDDYNMFKLYSLFFGHMEYDFIWVDNSWGEYLNMVDVTNAAAHEDPIVIFFGENIETLETYQVSYYPQMGPNNNITFTRDIKKSTQKWKTEDFVKTETNDSLILYLEHKYFMPDVLLEYNKLGLVKKIEDSTETFECKFKVKVDSSLSTPSTITTNFKANLIGANSLEPDKEYIISIFENNIKIEEISSTIHMDLDLIDSDYLVIISNTDQPSGYDEYTFELVDVISSDEDNTLNTGEYKLIFISKLPNVEMDETNNYIESFKNCNWILSVVDGRLGGEINS